MEVWTVKGLVCHPVDVVLVLCHLSSTFKQAEMGGPRVLIATMWATGDENGRTSAANRLHRVLLSPLAPRWLETTSTGTLHGAAVQHPDIDSHQERGQASAHWEVVASGLETGARRAPGLSHQLRWHCLAVHPPAARSNAHNARG